MDPTIRRLRVGAFCCAVIPVVWFAWLVCVSTGCGSTEKTAAPPPQPPPQPYIALSDPFAIPVDDPFSLPGDPAPLFHEADLLQVIHFGFDRHNISDSQTERLDALAGNISAWEVWVALTGHADNRGPAPYNQILGLRRAQAVRDYLIRAGVERWRISVVESHGEYNPTDGHTRNRRVEVRLED